MVARITNRNPCVTNCVICVYILTVTVAPRLAKFITKISQNNNSHKSRKAYSAYETRSVIQIAEGPRFESHHDVGSRADFIVLFVSSFRGLGSAVPKVPELTVSTQIDVPGSNPAMGLAQQLTFAYLFRVLQGWDRQF